MIKTIDINAKEWFDKINGNSYFAGEVVTDYGTKEQRVYKMPFQYGYGDQFRFEGMRLLQKEKVVIFDQHKSIWQNCEDLGIILRSNIQRNCLKRELKEFND